MAGRSRVLGEEEAVAAAKKFYDTEGPYVGIFQMATPVLTAHRNLGGYVYGNGRAEWSIKYRVEPDTGEEYFVRFFYQRPLNTPSWRVISMHMCTDECSTSCSKRPSTGFGTARLDLHTYRMQVQAMKVDELRRTCASKQLGNKGKKELLVKRLLDHAEQEDEAARLKEEEEEAEAKRLAQEAEKDSVDGAPSRKRKAPAGPAAVAVAKRSATAVVPSESAAPVAPAVSSAAAAGAPTSATSEDLFDSAVQQVAEHGDGAAEQEDAATAGVVDCEKAPSAVPAATAAAAAAAAATATATAAASAASGEGASTAAAAAVSDDDSDDSDDDSDQSSDDDLLNASLNPTKTAEQLQAEAKARREAHLKRQKLKAEGPTFEEEVAAAGGEAGTAIDLTTESAKIVRALFEIERASALASVDQPEKPTPSSFKVGFELMQHQKQALAWMQDRETNRVPFSGGILGDEMGLGKTAECLSVIVSDIEDQKQLSSRPGPTLIVCPTSVVDSWETELYSRFNPAFRPKFVTYLRDAKQMGAKQLQNLDIVITTFGSLLPSGLQLRSFDTDYDASKAIKKGNYPLFDVKWRRCVLDEAHYIRNHNSESARACRLLNAERRWAVTGTPIQNGVNDLLSLFMFLQFRPLDTPTLFHAAFGGNQKRDEYSGQQVSVPVNHRKLHAVLAPVMLRRRKDTKKPDGTPIVQLPKKTVSVEETSFSADEAEFYTQLEKRLQARFKKYADDGLIYQNYTNVLVMIQKLRQACNHPHLATNGLVATPGYQEEGKSLLDSLDAAGLTAVPEPPPEGTSSSIPAAIEQKLERLKDILTPPFEEECPICTDMLDPPSSVVCLCSHCFCKECIVEWRDVLGNSPCPQCRDKLDGDPLTPLHSVQARINERWPPPPKVKAEQDKMKEEKAAAAAAAAASKAKVKFYESSKLVRLMTELKKMKAKDGAMKCIVFSNFTSFLNLVMASIKHSDAGFRAVRVDGSMDVKSRQKQLQIFRTDARVSILIMSLKAGSHGLNLTCASNVVLCEPWWNPMPEQQAMDRVHRTGQTKPVSVIKLTVDGTIEQRILEMQLNKWQVADSVLGEDSGNGNGGKKTRKLSVQELFSLFGMSNR